MYVTGITQGGFDSGYEADDYREVLGETLQAMYDTKYDVVSTGKNVLKELESARKTVESFIVKEATEAWETGRMILGF